MDDWWEDLEKEILECLAVGLRRPADLSRALRISEAAVISVLSMLAAEGRVRICAVEPVPYLRAKAS